MKADRSRNRAGSTFLSFQRLAELRLASRPPQEQNKGLRDRPSPRGVTMFLLNECQHQVDARRDARRCPHPAVAKKDVVVDDPRLGKPLTQHVDVLPMRRRTASVQQAGLSKYERPGTDRRSACGRARWREPKPPDDARFRRRQRAGNRPARDDDGIRGTGAGQLRRAIARRSASARDESGFLRQAALTSREAYTS